MFTKLTALPGEGFFTQVPTHWLRDPRASAGLKAVLSYWQTHAIGYRVTIEQTIAEMAEGRDAIYAYVKHGIELGYLVRLQGRAAAGRFGVTEYTLGPAAYQQQYMRKWGSQGDGMEGQTIEDERGNPVAEAPSADGAKPAGVPVDNSAMTGVSAGRTAYGFTGSGRAVSGATVSGESDTKKINPKKISSKKDQKPPSPRSDSDAHVAREAGPPDVPRPTHVDVQAATGEGDGSPEQRQSEPPTLDTLARFAGQLAATAGWDPGVTRQVLDQLRARPGADQFEIARVMREVAAGDHGVTRSPRRMLTWWPSLTSHIPAPRPSEPAGPAWAQGAVRHLDRDRAMCRLHRGEPEGACGRCRADRLAVNEPESVPLPEEASGVTARELARSIAVQSGTNPIPRRRWAPAAPPAPTAPPSERCSAELGRLLTLAGHP